MKRLPALAALLACGCPPFHRGAMPGEPRTARFANIDGVRVRYTDQGHGPVVVLLHGFASSLETWSGVVPHLVDAHRVITLDLKGFGWSDRPEGDYSPQAEAKLVFGLLDHLGVGATAVVAHSWGASVALAMSLAQPKRVTRIALYDAWSTRSSCRSSSSWPGRRARRFLFGAFYDQRPEEKLEQPSSIRTPSRSPSWTPSRKP